MKFLIDMPLSPKTAEYLRSLGHDAVHAFEIGMSKSSDKSIFEFAKTESRIIITMDLDFGKILFHSRAKNPGTIIFRISYGTVEKINAILTVLIQRLERSGAGNSIIIVDDIRIRVRKLPL